MNKKSDVKKISLRNYFLVIVVSILVIAIALYIRAFYINYNSEVVKSSVFKEKISEVNFNELDYTIAEAGDALLYVGYTGNKDIYEMEKRLLKEIEKKSLVEKILYLDVSEYLENDEYVVKLKKEFSNIKNEITSAPMFIYIENGEGVEAMSSELKMVDYKVFNNIVSKYELE